MNESIFTPAQLLAHWQGHRALTRKVIEKFPEKELFEFSIGGMRPFSHMLIELLSIAGPGLKEIVENSPGSLHEDYSSCSTKEEILQKWDEETKSINEYFNQISVDRFAKTFNLFGQYESPIIDNILYFIDNEVHHRGQGYTYLRALNIEPPLFWER